MRKIQYETLRSEIFCRLYFTYHLYEVTQHYNAKKQVTLNKISNWSLFKLIISDQALITLK